MERIIYCAFCQSRFASIEGTDVYCYACKATEKAKLRRPENKWSRFDWYLYWKKQGKYEGVK